MLAAWIQNHFVSTNMIQIHTNYNYANEENQIFITQHLPKL